jgi:hypothetical protein
VITDPGGVATAAAQAERAPRAKVTVDWDADGVSGVDDVSAQAGAVKVARQITGDLPDEVALVEGSSVAEATVELELGDPADNTKHAAWWFSRLNTASPLTGKERLSRPVTVDVGFDTATGTPLVRRFTGLSRALPVSSTNRTATLTALDNREFLRTKVAVPALAADVGLGSQVKPGFNAQWLVDYVLRTNGFNASPKWDEDTTTHTATSATMHGSAAPDIGTLLRAGQWSVAGGTITDVCTFVQGRFGYALAGPTVSGGAPTAYNFVEVSFPQPMPMPDQLYDYVHVEWWGQISAAVTTLPQTMLYLVSGGSAVGYVELMSNVGVRSLRVVYYRNYYGTAQQAIVALNTSASYFKVSIQDRAGSGSRVRITQDAATTIVDNADSAFLADYFATMTSVIAAPMGLMEGLNVTWGSPGVDSVPPTSWGYTAGAELGASANELVAALPSDARDAWGLLKELAQAEFAWVGFSEAGVPFYRTGEYWTRTAQQTVSQTITADRDLLEFAYDDNIDQVRNQVSVPVNALSITPVQDVWTADPLRFNGSSVTSFFVTFADPLFDLDTSVTSAGSTPATSRVRANTRSDGTGLDRSSYVGVTVDFWTAGTAKLTVSNRYSQSLYLVDTTGAAALILAGRQVIVNQVTATAAYEEDAPSIALYGPQPLDLPSNPWRQDLSFARGVAQSLLGRLADPHITYTGLRVLGDPRRQLGDRVRLVDPDGTAANVEVWLTGVEDDITAGGGYTQGLSARQATTVAIWDVSLWDDGTVWGP